MRPFLSVLIIMLSAFLSPSVGAAKLFALSWSEFVILSQGGASGPVRVSGTQTPAGIAHLKVEGFGREFVAPEATVKELQGFFVNGMRLSYGSGWGHSHIYLTFYGFASGGTETRNLSVSKRSFSIFLSRTLQRINNSLFSPMSGLPISGKIMGAPKASFLWGVEHGRRL